jgi:triacylglycerol esterase/lipase EstA (alpha/beta hydrolase family)
LWKTVGRIQDGPSLGPYAALLPTNITRTSLGALLSLPVSNRLAFFRTAGSTNRDTDQSMLLRHKHQQQPLSSTIAAKARRLAQSMPQSDEQPRHSTAKINTRRYHNRPHASRLPIVLCHGLFGFDKIGPASMPRLQMHYWGGIAKLLQEHAGEIHVARVPSIGSIESRAMELHRFLESNLSGRDVNLVAHSMGGLDSRYLVTHGPPASYRIRSLTTVSVRVCFSSLN